MYKETDFFQLCDEVVNHGFDLRSFGREQNQFLIDEVELQHVFGRNGDEHDVCIAARGLQWSQQGIFMMVMVVSLTEY